MAPKHVSPIEMNRKLIFILTIELSLLKSFKIMYNLQKFVNYPFNTLGIRDIHNIHLSHTYQIASLMSGILQLVSYAQQRC